MNNLGWMIKFRDRVKAGEDLDEVDMFNSMFVAEITQLSYFLKKNFPTTYPVFENELREKGILPPKKVKLEIVKTEKE